MIDPAQRSGLHGGDIARVELPGLTPLRGIAALVVVLYHSSYLAYHYGAGGVPAVWARGYLAVDLFFFLSGFVLSHVYGYRSSRDRNWGAVRGFLWARFCRIYPACLFVTIVYALAYSLGSLTFPVPVAFAPQLVASLLLMQVPWLHDIWINSPSWSISAELYAYVLFPFIVPVIARLSNRVVLALGITLLLGIAADHLIFTHQDQNWGWEALVRAVPEFVAGIFAYRAYKEQWGRKFWQSDAVLVGITAAIAAGLLLANLSDGVVVVLLPALVFAAVSNSGHMAKFLNISPLRWLGEISYSVYIFQTVVFMLVVRFAPVLVALGVRGVWFEALAAVAAVSGGVLVHRRVDVPARAALRRLPERLAARAAARRPIRGNIFLR